MTSSKQDWPRLGERVAQRRRELGLTQEAVRWRGGPSTATMRLVEGALQEVYRPSVLASLERALQWAPGSIDAILAGGEPTAIEPLAQSGGTSAMSRPGWGDDRLPVGARDDAIDLVLNSDLPEDEKHRLVRDLLQDLIDERQRRVERAQRYIELYRRAQGE